LPGGLDWSMSVRGRGRTNIPWSLAMKRRVVNSGVNLVEERGYLHRARVVCHDPPLSVERNTPAAVVAYTSPAQMDQLKKECMFPSRDPRDLPPTSPGGAAVIKSCTRSPAAAKRCSPAGSLASTSTVEPPASVRPRPGHPVVVGRRAGPPRSVCEKRPARAFSGDPPPRVGIPGRFTSGRPPACPKSEERMMPHSVPAITAFRLAGESGKREDPVESLDVRERLQELPRSSTS